MSKIIHFYKKPNFELLTQKIETIFIPYGDKAVKLDCCIKFVISLGQNLNQ